MSGGSYNYLCHVFEAADLVGRDGDLDDMSKRLAELGYASDAARETEELLLLMRQWRNRVDARMERLRAVWKAVEWWDSCDWLEDQVREALAEYRGDGAKPAEPALPEEPAPVPAEPEVERLKAVVERIRARCREGRDSPYSEYANVVKDDILDIIGAAGVNPEGRL